ncbi:MAG: PLP-dependent transferase [Rhodanobacteraceae bacterium]|nr:PLP-dependent transferase [Rhodanobacteraceae bacterium]
MWFCTCNCTKPVAPEQRRAHGIEEGLVRLPIGLEDLSDITEDLLLALDRCTDCVRGASSAIVSANSHRRASPV